MNPIPRARALAEQAGLSVIEIGLTGGTHVKARLQRPDGATANFIFPNSPSDHRAAKNKLAVLRRFARGDFDPVVHRSPKK